MHDLAMSLIRSFAEGLGKDKHYFDPWFKDESTAVFRGLHYKPRPSDVILDNPNDQKLVAPEHSDSGFITLLTTFMYPGLQVLLEGEYRSVKSKKNAIVINIGATLQKISGERIKATMHRVLDIGKERYSSPFFFEPKFSSRIAPNTLYSSRKLCEDLEYENAPENQEEMAKVPTYGKWVVVSKSTVGEWKGFTAPKIKYDYKKRYT